MSRTKTPAARRYHGVVASLPCVLCDQLGQQQTTPTTVHHIREGQGAGQRAGDFLVAALCKDCHQGPCGVHGDRSLLRIARIESETDLVDITAEQAWRAN